MKSNNELLKIPTAAELAARINKVGADLVLIAKELVRAVDENPNFTEELATQGINRELIRRLEKFGRNEIDEQLVLMAGSGAGRLLAVPISEQRRVLLDGVEILEDDEQTVRKIPLHALTPQQALKAFNSDHVRDLAEQRTFIRQRRQQPAPDRIEIPYTAHKGYVVTWTKPGMKWTRKEWEHVLAEMK